MTTRTAQLADVFATALESLPIEQVWDANWWGPTKTLDVHVKRLRAKVETDPANPAHIVTVRGLDRKSVV
mgnify:CR=1 FL=1